MTTDGLVQILLAVISLIGTILTAVAVPYINSKLTANKLTELKFWVKMAIGAAEQTFSDPQQGALKKQFVINFLNNKGITIAEDELDVLIEACVRELKLSSDQIAAYGVE